MLNWFLSIKINNISQLKNNIFNYLENCSSDDNIYEIRNEFKINNYKIILKGCMYKKIIGLITTGIIIHMEGAFTIEKIEIKNLQRQVSKDLNNQ